MKAKYDSEFGALRPNFATDKNIADFVLNKIKAYEGIDTTNVKVRLLNTEDVNYIGVDGAIFYKKMQRQATLQRIYAHNLYLSAVMKRLYQKTELLL